MAKSEAEIEVSKLHGHLYNLQNMDDSSVSRTQHKWFHKTENRYVKLIYTILTKYKLHDSPNITSNKPMKSPSIAYLKQNKLRSAGRQSDASTTSRDYYIQEQKYQASQQCPVMKKKHNKLTKYRVISYKLGVTW